MRSGFRIGLIVPSSNTTMETELPELFRRREQQLPERFTFHSNRMAMQQVTPEALARMDCESDRCAMELADARCDVLAYACLVAVMASGQGYHCVAETRLAQVVSAAAGPVPVVTSAGALVEGIRALGARRVALIAPYLRSLTRVVIDYLGAYGIEVVDAVSLEIADNVAVGRLDPMDLLSVAERLDVSDADALVASACVQMPSLPVIAELEQRLGKPVLSAATATTRQLLTRLGLDPVIPAAGSLLSDMR